MTTISSMLKKFTDGVWYEDRKQKFMGLELGTRMSVYQVDDGLLVHSPVAPTEELIQELNQLGQVKHIIAPNLLHHLYFKDFAAAFPEAKKYCAPGLEKKRSDISFDEVIQLGQEYPWSNSFNHAIIEGVPVTKEVVLLHKPSSTLVVTDQGVNIHDEAHWFTRMAFKMMGFYGKFGWSKMEKKMFIRNQAEFKNSVDGILKWNFNKIMLCHGRPVLENGHQQFKQAFEE